MSRPYGWEPHQENRLTTTAQAVVDSAMERPVTRDTDGVRHRDTLRLMALLVEALDLLRDEVARICESVIELRRNS